MRPLQSLRAFGYRLLTLLLGRWLRPTALDAEPLLSEQVAARCYVLPQRSSLDLLALELACARAGLPSPRESLATRPEERLARSFFYLAHTEGFLLKRRSMRARSPLMRGALEALREGRPIEFVPVSIFWGRAPQREKSILRLMFSERWAVTGWLRKLLALVFDRSHLFVQYGSPIGAKELLTGGAEGVVLERRLARLLRTRFRRHREALIGPDLSHRRTLLSEVLREPRVRQAVHATADAAGSRAGPHWQQARAYAAEIASDISFPVVRFFDVLLTWLWNRLYDGVDVSGIESVKQVAEDHTLIYVPSHRSHIDYLLLSYVLFYNGLMLPHIAAGKNLNLPIVGPLLRRGGAFFMRRSFRDDPLYAAVFEAYLGRVFARGFSVEYFVEGGRSRTGRLLPPRPGMLRMTLASFLHGSGRPFAFVPVYFGYEKVIEARSYMGELRGSAKRKESVLGLLRSLRFLRQSFGKVQVNFGTPLDLGAFLDRAQPGWRDAAASEAEPAWFGPVVRSLGQVLHQRVNAAASLNPVGAVSLALLTTPRQALDEAELALFLDDILALVREAPVSDRVTVTALDGPGVIAYCERSGLLRREQHPLGDILSVTGADSILLTWYRNNVQHLCALPSLLAALLVSGRRIPRARLGVLVATAYPYLRQELYLPWSEDELEARMDAELDLLVARGLVRRSGDVFSAVPAQDPRSPRLHLLARIIMPTLERDYIVLSLIAAQAESGVEREQLEAACVLTAQRMARLYGLDAPEFFDRTLFRRFIDLLVERGLAHSDSHGVLRPEPLLGRILLEARRVVSPEFRQGVTVARALPDKDQESDEDSGAPPLRRAS
ncbi:MAG: glycerol-3-phosphate 1-O-acyltransferase PlsB [Pseudomonadales bacterium]|jgi:glycerol-3-phosphate O-acyltransferase|nr:glycerol-3-phosphate 1-O-acyltransferase PlsB [Pseudomonadales bacterium]